jgi:hypothetical protein
MYLDEEPQDQKQSMNTNSVRSEMSGPGSVPVLTRPSGENYVEINYNHLLLEIACHWDAPMDLDIYTVLQNYF